MLSLCDELLVTGDSAMMLAEASVSGIPTAFFSLPPRQSLSWFIPAGWLTAWRRREIAQSRSLGPTSQQSFLSRWVNQLIDWGWLSPHRDFEALHHTIITQQLAQKIDVTNNSLTTDSVQAIQQHKPSDLAFALSKVRRKLYSGQVL